MQIEDLQILQFTDVFGLITITQDNARRVRQLEERGLLSFDVKARGFRITKAGMSRL
jgi:hypothetical protein